jgi:hypothetical protein
MTIISKYKDFYDYLTGIYGIDPLVVYERFSSQGWLYRDSREVELKPGPVVSLHSITKDKNNRLLNFYILGIRLPVVIFEMVLYVTPKELISLITSKNFKEHASETLKDSLWTALHGVYGYDKKEKMSSYYWPQAPVDYNSIYKCPVILIDGFNIYLNPKLKEFRIGELISPKEMYLNLTDYFSKKDPDMPKDPKDMNRYTAKGFDKKTSFRNIK